MWAEAQVEDGEVPLSSVRHVGAGASDAAPGSLLRNLDEEAVTELWRSPSNAVSLAGMAERLFPGARRRKVSGWRGWLLGRTEVVLRDDEGRDWLFLPEGFAAYRGWNVMTTGDGSRWQRPRQ